MALAHLSKRLCMHRFRLQIVNMRHVRGTGAPVRKAPIAKTCVSLPPHTDSNAVVHIRITVEVADCVGLCNFDTTTASQGCTHHCPCNVHGAPLSELGHVIDIC